MTSNHLDKLDPALIRPGRCDVHHEIGLASSKQVHGIVMNFYPDAPKHDVETFVAKIQPKTISPAAIQGHLFSHISGGLLDAIRHVDKLVPEKEDTLDTLDVL
jgi:chaperone BCS1